MSHAAIPRAADTLRRAEFELTLAGEQQLAHKVAAIRQHIAALVRAVHAEREASNEFALRSARRAMHDAIAALRGEPSA